MTMELMAAMVPMTSLMIELWDVKLLRVVVYYTISMGHLLQGPAQLEAKKARGAHTRALSCLRKQRRIKTSKQSVRYQKQYQIQYQIQYQYGGSSSELRPLPIELSR